MEIKWLREQIHDFTSGTKFRDTSTKQEALPFTSLSQTKTELQNKTGLKKSTDWLKGTLPLDLAKRRFWFKSLNWNQDWQYLVLYVSNVPAAWHLQGLWCERERDPSRPCSTPYNLWNSSYCLQPPAVSVRLSVADVRGWMSLDQTQSFLILQHIFFKTQQKCMDMNRRPQLAQQKITFQKSKEIPLLDLGKGPIRVDGLCFLRFFQTFFSDQTGPLSDRNLQFLCPHAEEDVSLVSCRDLQTRNDSQFLSTASSSNTTRSPGSKSRDLDTHNFTVWDSFWLSQEATKNVYSGRVKWKQSRSLTRPFYVKPILGLPSGFPLLNPKWKSAWYVLTIKPIWSCHPSCVFPWHSKLGQISEIQVGHKWYTFLCPNSLSEAAIQHQAGLFWGPVRVSCLNSTCMRIWHNRKMSLICWEGSQGVTDKQNPYKACEVCTADQAALGPYPIAVFLQYPPWSLFAGPECHLESTAFFFSLSYISLCVVRTGPNIESDLIQQKFHGGSYKKICLARLRPFLANLAEKLNHLNPCSSHEEVTPRNLWRLPLGFFPSVNTRNDHSPCQKQPPRPMHKAVTKANQACGPVDPAPCNNATKGFTYSRSVWIQHKSRLGGYPEMKIDHYQGSRKYSSLLFSKRNDLRVMRHLKRGAKIYLGSKTIFRLLRREISLWMWHSFIWMHAVRLAYSCSQSSWDLSWNIDAFRRAVPQV